MEKDRINQLLPVNTVIDSDLCSGCGLCIDVCPMRTISMANGKARVTGDKSLNCGHCAAVCPERAVTVATLDRDMSTFASFTADDRWLPHGDFDTPQLVRLMASRRSCRSYLDREVDRTVLEDLAKIGAMAPSATNSQSWAFTILPDRSRMVALLEPVIQFYERLNKLVKKSWFRSAMRMIGRDTVDFYYHAYLDYVETRIIDWRDHGKDGFFHTAPAAIIIGSKPGGMLPKEDALLATQNVLLAAHGMGYGTCLLGLATGAMQKERSISAAVNIAPEETVHSVIAIGHPAETYETQAGRKHADIRFADL